MLLNIEIIRGKILTDIAATCKAQEKMQPKEHRGCIKLNTRQLLGLGNQGLRLAINYVIAENGPEHNDNAPNACLWDATKRWKTGMRVTLKANAMVLAIARAYLNEENVIKFERIATEKGVPLQTYHRGIIWGGDGTLACNNLAKYQSLLINLKCSELRTMNATAIYYEGEREVANFYREEIIKITESSQTTYSLAKKRVLDKYHHVALHRAYDIYQTKLKDDTALYYRALKGLNITSVTNFEIENVYTELNNRPPISKSKRIFA